MSIIIYNQLKPQGTTQKNLNAKIVRNLLIKIAPLNEQKRIVSKIESIFAHIDAGKEKLENVKVLLKQSRQSVLKLELEVLLKKHRIEKLANVCTKITDGSHNSPSNSSTNEIPYVTAKNIRPRKLDFTEITYVTKEDHKEIFSRCNPEKGDVLYTKDGTVGYAVVNECDFEFSLLSSVALLKPDHTILDSYYLENFLNNPITYDSVIKKMSGTALRRIILKRIKEIQIPIPSLNEQKRIVSKLESILGGIDSTEKSLDAALSKMDLLKKSVLKYAFEGKLVPQDPNDEPASALLERIKKEKIKLEQGESVKRRKRNGK